jgi:hypothetical protein
VEFSSFWTISASDLRTPSSYLIRCPQKSGALYSQGQTIFKIGPVRASRFDITADFMCPGEDACDPGVVRVIFSMTEAGALLKHEDDHSVQLVLNEETELAAASPQYLQRSAGGAWVTELIMCLIPTTDFRTVANAEKVEYRIGPSKGELTKKQRKALEALAAELPELEEPEITERPDG